MAGRVVPLRVGGVELLVEASPVAGSESTSARLDRAQDAVAEAWERAQSAIVEVAASTVSTIGQLGRSSVRPDEVKVTFGLKFSAQGNVIVAGASGEATLEVSLTYRADPDGAGTGGS
ncbi:MAG: CU044_2847 family protein [Pseudonocardiaceae bacterium]